MSSVKAETTKKLYPSLNLIIIQGIIYTILQMSLFFLKHEPYIDYYNHINWGIGFAQGQVPYKDYSGNEYPVLSAYGWILSYQLSPSKSYIWLSIMMNFPYWILSIFGGISLYKLLIDRKISNKHSIYIVTFFFFLPLNLIDTINNHGSLGTASTVIIGIYLWYRDKHFCSAAFIAAGFSIKLYPIFIAPFLVLELNNQKKRIKYGGYLIFWILIFHIPVLTILDDYYRVLFWRTTEKGGITYSKFIEVITSPFGIDGIPTLFWLFALMITAGILIFEHDLHMLDKFAIIVMVNNLLEPRGGIGHIVTVLPIVAIYYIGLSRDRSEKIWFWSYLILSTFWGFDRLFLKIRDYNDFTGGFSTTLMTLSTTFIFIIYLRGLYNLKLLQFNFKNQIKSWVKNKTSGKVFNQ